MSKRATTNPLFEPSPEISEQLEEMLHGIKDLREVHDLTDSELDMLLNTIKVRTGSKEVLMDYVNMIAKRNDIASPGELYNLKVKVLLENLAKKMCRCADSSMEARSKVGVCRRTIFQNRGLDFFTYECSPDAKNPRRSPLLNKQKGTNKILQRYLGK